MKRVMKREQGEFGIGSLIIFIAMIIVSAVTAVVLIQISYQLQQQAEDTGNVAIQDVSTGFKIISMGGYRYNDTWGTTPPYHDQIDWIDIKVSLIPGSPPVNLEDVILEVSDGQNSVDLVFNSSVSFDGGANPQGGAGVFGIRVIRDLPPKTLSNYVISAGDIVALSFNATANGLALLPQTYLSIKIIPKHGVSTFQQITTPSVYVSRYVELM